MSDKEQIKFMNMAIEKASENVKTGKGVPFGAVIVKNGKVIAATGNTVFETYDPTAHAEVAAIRLACNELKSVTLEGCEIYASCEPCPMCLSAIYWAKIDKLYYAATKEDASAAGFDDTFLYKEIALNPGKRSLNTQHFMHQEALVSFEEWKRKLNIDDI